MLKSARVLLLLLVMLLILCQYFIDLVEVVLRHFDGSLLGCELVVRVATAGVTEWLVASAATC